MVRSYAVNYMRILLVSYLHAFFFLFFTFIYNNKNSRRINVELPIPTACSILYGFLVSRFQFAAVHNCNHMRQRDDGKQQRRLTCLWAHHQQIMRQWQYVAAIFVCISLFFFCCSTNKMRNHRLWSIQFTICNVIHICTVAWWLYNFPFYFWRSLALSFFCRPSGFISMFSFSVLEWCKWRFKR